MKKINEQETRWASINWRSIDQYLFKLQKRIYESTINGKTKDVHKFQKILISSQAAKLRAVRRVTQDNRGKKTAGVDGINSLTPAQRLKTAFSLQVDGKSSPIRRVYIPKPNGEERPLGIPTIQDRAKQTLVLMSLEPEWEAKFEENSYGFRPGRASQDAIEAIFIAINQKAKYFLDADIAKCFDRISHKKL
jgi:RNA-directed DNA polymerase